jgi:L-asparaginase
VTVRILATGGTIASRMDPTTGAVVPVLAPDELVEAVPGLADLGPFEVEELARISSWDNTPQLMERVAAAARRAVTEDGVDGVVVTHGTDTVEETLYLTDLLAGQDTGDGAIAFTCAMRAAGELGADGPRNLRDAVRVARHPGARGRGALLVVNDEIHCARWVTKTDTTNVSTFRSYPGGPVGNLEMGVPRFTLDTPARPPHGDRIDPAVALIKTYTGMDGSMLRWLVDDHKVHGLVLEGTGAGNVPGGLEAGIDHALRRGVAVVLSSRCAGGTTQPIYGGDGGGATLDERGVVRSNGLSSHKARLGLMVALGISRDLDHVRAWFAAA